MRAAPLIVFSALAAAGVFLVALPLKTVVVYQCPSATTWSGEKLSPDDRENRCKSNAESCPASLLESSSPLAPCGDVCRYDLAAKVNYTNSRAATKNGSPYFQQLQKNFQCCNIMQRLVRSRAANDSEWPPPRQIPREQEAAFTQNGTIRVASFYLAERYAGNVARHWTPQSISDMNVSLQTGASFNGQWATYGLPDAKKLSAVIAKHVPHGSSVLVVGSERPWVEVLALNAGAAHVTTVEYAQIISTDSRITTWTPPELGKSFLACPGDFLFDAVISYSSVEHSGLGRYGDLLNPFGDLEAVAQMWCMLRPGGLLVLGVPIGHFLKSGRKWSDVDFATCNDCDKIEYNAHRFYGPKRLPHLLANFELVEFGVLGTQEALVARKVIPTT